ncbi:STAS domain-containing protein [Salirhabdus sp. Marseille-P4669]|uniref:STAS domain-containing protein n=1 Tax=Salirhabdus sp. Marseille-P4669 TaxID=2042310 RepID=UPI000C7CDA8A|nr:STAS domain-containing protein [Salirhabdus sp. Marseille-P4669]
MEPLINVVKKIDGDRCTLALDGVLDYSSMDPFIEEIRSLEKWINNVIVDFSGLQFIDSTGIGAIINLVHEANTNDFEVELVGINEEVQMLFDTIGVFKIMESLKKGGN